MMSLGATEVSVTSDKQQGGKMQWLTARGFWGPGKRGASIGLWENREEAKLEKRKS